MSTKGYYGLSFPFRLSTKGGLAMSGTSSSNSQHINESINQLLLTNLNERVVELNIGSNISSQLFNSLDDSIITLIKNEILISLTNYETRIEISENDIQINESEDGNLIIDLSYKVLDYTNAEFNLNINLGGIK